MPGDEDEAFDAPDDMPGASQGPTRTPGFLIPPGYPQVLNFDFNTLLNHGHLTPEVLEHLTGLLAALQDSFRNASPRSTGASVRPVRFIEDPDNCGDLGSDCPAVETFCPSDCAENFCNADACGADTCPRHIPTCIADFGAVCNADACPDHVPTCIDEFGCISFEETDICPERVVIPKTKTSDGS